MTGTVIVGGGPAGTAAAITLARGGIPARLFERTTEPHDMVCGGFLGWDALALLDQLGIDAFALGARRITKLRLVAGLRKVEAPLPHTAAGLSRRRLDAALLAVAADAGTQITRGAMVRGADPQARILRIQDSEEIGFDALFLATGKHELRGLARPLDGRRASLAIGLRAALPASPQRDSALAGVIELHLFNGGYAGLLLQEDGSTNLCLSVSQQRLADAGGTLPLLAELVRRMPVLAERIGQDIPTDLSAIAGVPYGWRASNTTPGIFRVGDQGAVIASLAGDGIAIALAGGIGAAQALLAGGPDAAPIWQASFRRRTRRSLGVAEVLRHNAEQPASRHLLMTLLRFFPGLTVPAALLTRIGSQACGE